MTHRLAIASVALCGLMCGCHRGARHVNPPPAPVQPLFGPVMTREVIGGRAVDGRGRVWLLANGQAIVGIDLRVGIASRTEISRPSGKTCWGLARLDEGSLWTLFGRSTLAEVGADGHIAREIALQEPHFGLYARGDRLVYQPARLVPSGDLLFAGVPGNPHPERWSAIEPRSFPAMARASAAALNMVVCGATRTTEQPCWFPDDASIALIGPAGETRRVALSGLTRVAPEVLLTSDNPARPLRDVFVEESGTIWVLSSGTPAVEAGDVPGGWLLAEYTGAGAPVRMRRLSEPVRLILDVNRERLIVLAGTGMVAEVLR
jgi:hypothetical protein